MKKSNFPLTACCTFPARVGADSEIGTMGQKLFHYSSTIVSVANSKRKNPSCPVLPRPLSSHTSRLGGLSTVNRLFTGLWEHVTVSRLCSAASVAPENKAENPQSVNLIQQVDYGRGGMKALIKDTKLRGNIECLLDSFSLYNFIFTGSSDIFVWEHHFVIWLQLSIFYTPVSLKSLLLTKEMKVKKCIQNISKSVKNIFDLFLRKVSHSKHQYML